MIITAILDERELEARIRRIVAELIGANPPRELDTGVRAWLITSQIPADILVVAEAPDTDAPGVRDEPHWRASKSVQEGDLLFFRDSRRRHIVGYARASRLERGEHRHRSGCPAIRWWLDDPVRFPTPIPDDTFVRPFHRHDDRRRLFHCCDATAASTRRPYCYPLVSPLRDALLHEAGAEQPVNNTGPRSSE